MKALYYGDNLQVLRDSIATESVDLIYLDPPFNSNATVGRANVCFRGQSGRSTDEPKESAYSQDRKFAGYEIRPDERLKSTLLGQSVHRSLIPG